mmetsp:Transcript_1964/g.2910  ORF Transcript_1964/g.2910 Transcript_1964/m.2910 type:complete len:167 (-) Transcript_1964:1071-1571(-)
MSQIGSRASQRSRGVAKNSYVDESLFGGKKPASGTGNRMAPTHTVKTATGMISLDELRNIRTKTEKNNQNDAVIIGAKDLDRIKMATVVKTKEQTIQEKKLAEEQKNMALAKSQARKAKMQELDQKRAQKIKPTEFQEAEKNKAETLLSKAQKQLDSEMDDVKHMN